MARWKALVEFVLGVIERLFLSLTVEALQGKMCQNSLPPGGGMSLGAKISGGTGRPTANILTPLERQLIALKHCRVQFLANVNSRSRRSLYAIARPSVVCRSFVCLSVVCNVRAPYSGGSDLRQYFYGIRYHGHLWTSTEN